MPKRNSPSVVLNFSWKRVVAWDVFLSAFSVFVADQLTKFWIVQNIAEGSQRDLMPGLSLVHTKNRGAAFGMFHHASAEFRLIFFGLVTLLCLGLLIYALGTLRREEKFQRLCLSLILGGAFGNILDRVAFGEVTDFIDCYFRTYHWPAFNIADSAITVAVLLMVVTSISLADIRVGLRQARQQIQKWKNKMGKNKERSR